MAFIFQCDDGYGIFVRQSQLVPLDTEEEGEDGSAETTPSASSSATTPASDKPKSRYDYILNSDDLSYFVK